MATINLNTNLSTSKCRDVIGVRGMCATEYPYNLDTLGISFNKASKLADSSHVSARQLIEDMVNMAWQDVFSDIRIDGFRVNGISKTYRSVLDASLPHLPSGTYTTSFIRNCDIEQHFINTAVLSIAGTLALEISIILDGLQQVVYNGSATNEDVIITLDNTYNYDSISFKVVATGGGTLSQTNSGDVFAISGYLACSEQLFLCKYWNYLVRAVMYKATAHILNTSLFSDRYNDLIVYKKDDVAIRISQLDSSMNVLGTVERINTNGLYQKEIENINLKLKQIVKDSYCTCCFECDNVINSSISIP